MDTSVVVVDQMYCCGLLHRGAARLNCSFGEREGRAPLVARNR